jgi:hypothetical protein
MEAKHKGSFDMRVISKVTGIFWNNASFEEKTVYKNFSNVLMKFIMRENIRIC